MTFKQDLKKAQAIERQFCKLLKTKYGALRTQLHRTSKWDVSAEFKLSEGLNGRHWVTFEVKHDKKSVTTGNIAVEYKCRGKDSGIRVTQAKWWVVKSRYWYIMEVEKLKKLIAEHKYKRNKLDAGDAGSYTHLYLFDRKEFIKECQKI